MGNEVATFNRPASSAFSARSLSKATNWRSSASISFRNSSNVISASSCVWRLLLQLPGEIVKPNCAIAEAPPGARHRLQGFVGEGYSAFALTGLHRVRLAQTHRKQLTDKSSDLAGCLPRS